MLAHRILTSALAVCLVLSLGLGVRAQGPQGGLEGLTLTLIDEGGFPVVLDTKDFEIHLDGPAGAWCYVFARAYVTLPPVGQDSAADAFRSLGFDQWLSPVQLQDAASWLPGISLHPESSVELGEHPGSVLDHYARCIAGGDSENVRAYCQPILLGGEGPASTLAWDAQDETWMDNQKPGGGFTLVREWTKVLSWPEPDFSGVWTNTHTFSAERLMQTAVERQAPTSAQAGEFFNDWLPAAADWGLYVDLQAMAVIDNSAEPGSSAGTTGGLPTLPASPWVILSGIRAVRPIYTAPLGGGGSGVFVGAALAPLGPVVGPNSLRIPIDGMRPPLSAQVVVGGRTATFPGVYDGVGHARVAFPVALPVGTSVGIVSLTNAVGVTIVTNPGWDQMHVIAPTTTVP